MLGKTHLAIALFFGLLVEHMTGIRIGILGTIALFLGALLPDLDEHKSALGRKAKIIAWLFPHRGVFHSVLFAVFFTILLYGIAPRQGAALFFLLGYLSHIFSEAITPRGVRPFFPSTLRLKGPVRVGKTTEHVLFWTLVLVDAYLLIAV
ncbi:metal-dependent hydrolase [Candidatus Woesearchaeota archaeon]|nr:MAG: metal-dependent hydrolase [Candidatus Woesearchaeota archaeon]